MPPFLFLLRPANIWPHKGARYQEPGLNAEAERHAITAVGAVGAAGAVGVDIAEVRAVGGVRRTQPPDRSLTLTVVTFLDTACIVRKDRKCYRLCTFINLIDIRYNRSVKANLC